MALVPCDPIAATFICGNGSTSCDKSSETFQLTESNCIVLRDYQAAAIQQSGSSVAILLQPDTTLSVIVDSASGGKTSTVTVTATTTASASACSSREFTAGSVAGASAGTGIPLLIMLISACIVISHLKKRIQQAEQERGPELAPKQAPPIDHQSSFPSFPAPSNASPVLAMPYVQQPIYGPQTSVIPEVGDQGVREMGTDSARVELGGGVEEDKR